MLQPMTHTRGQPFRGRPDPLLEALSGITQPFGTTSRLGTLQLPPYALDGRSLEWNTAHTAVAFDSSEAEYFSDIAGVSSSMLRALNRSPAHAKAAALGHKATTPSQRIGRAVHCAVLEPDRFKGLYVCWNGTRRGYRWEAFAEKHDDREILNAKEWDQVEACTEAIRAAVLTTAGGTCTVADLIAGARTERVIYWLDEATGLTCKARLDIMARRAVADLKTTDDARPGAFAQQCARQGYHIQAAHYLAGERQLTDSTQLAPYLLIAAELQAPHSTLVHPAHVEHFIEPGEKDWRAAMATMLECVRTNSWPGYPAVSAPLRLPLHHRYPDQSLSI